MMYDPELERQVIGGMMDHLLFELATQEAWTAGAELPVDDGVWRRACADVFRSGVVAADFFLTNTRAAFGAITYLLKERRQVSPEAVYGVLQQSRQPEHRAITLAWLVECMEMVVSVFGLGEAARQVHELAMKRRAVAVGHALVGGADPEKAQALLVEISGDRQTVVGIQRPKKNGAGERFLCFACGSEAVAYDPEARPVCAEHAPMEVWE